MKNKIMFVLLGIELVASLFYGWSESSLSSWAHTDPATFAGSPDASFNFQLLLKATGRGEGLLVGLWLGSIATVVALNGIGKNSDKGIYRPIVLLVLVFPLIVLAAGKVLAGIITR
jgi:hypothetical protein